MKKLGRTRDRFGGEDVNPMNYLSNLSDVMLILAVGIMLALVVHWNVDITASGGVSSLEELRALRDMGTRAAILGKALYTGRLDLKTVLAEFQD